MYYCTLIFQLIYTALDLLMVFGNWNFMMQNAIGLGTLFIALPYILVAFFILAFYVSYKAYSLFKQEYIN